MLLRFKYEAGIVARPWSKQDQRDFERLRIIPYMLYEGYNIAYLNASNGQTDPHPDHAHARQRQQRSHVVDVAAADDARGRLSKRGRVCQQLEPLQVLAVGWAPHQPLCPDARLDWMAPCETIGSTLQ